MHNNWNETVYRISQEGETENLELIGLTVIISFENHKE